MGRSTLYLVTLLVVLAAAIAQELYTDKYDHINVEEVLANEELRMQYYNCLMDTGPCVGEEQELMRKHAAEAFVTQCRKCTEVQKKQAEKVVEWYTKNQPQQWSALVDKFIADAKKLNITPEI